MPQPSDQDETTRLQAIRHYRKFCEMVAKERAAGIVIETTDEWWGEIAETLLAVEQSASALEAARQAIVDQEAASVRAHTQQAHRISELEAQGDALRQQIAELTKERDAAYGRLLEAATEVPGQSLSDLAAHVVTAGWRLKRQRDDLAVQVNAHGALIAAERATVDALTAALRELVEKWRRESKTWCACGARATVYDPAGILPAACDEHRAKSPTPCYMPLHMGRVPADACADDLAVLLDRTGAGDGETTT